MIVVFFNKPMVSLRELPHSEGTGPLEFQPQIKGRYRWLGTSTLTFVPDDTLSFATAYKAIIPAGTRSLGGSTLTKDYSWTLQTPRPVLVRTPPGNAAKWAELNQLIYLQFDQPIDPERAGPFVTVYQDNATESFQLRYPTDAEMTKYRWAFPKKYVLVIDPDKPFHTGASIRIQLKAGLPGSVGLLGMDHDASFFFSTYPQFCFYGMASRNGQSPDQNIRLDFSNPVAMKGLVRHISFRPKLSFPDDYFSDDYERYDKLYLSLPLLPDTEYVVTVDKSLKDIFGNELGRDTTFTFTTGPFAPFCIMVTGPGLLEAYGPKTFQLVARNVDTVRVRMAPIPVDSLIPLLTRGNLFYSDRPFYRLKFEVDSLWALRLSRNRLTRLPVRLERGLAGADHGFVFAEINRVQQGSDAGSYYKSLFQVTSLCITAKFSPENNLIWVTRLKDTAPVPDAHVQIRDTQNHILWSGKTDSQGIVKTPGWGTFGMKPMSWWGQPRLWVFAKSGDDWADARTEDGTGIEPWRFNIPYSWQPTYQPLEGQIFTDRGLYLAGDVVHIKGIVRKKWKTSGPFLLASPLQFAYLIRRTSLC